MVKNILTTYNSNLFERMLSSNYTLVGPLDPLTSSIFQSEGQVQLRMKLSVIRPVTITHCVFWVPRESVFFKL